MDFINETAKNMITLISIITAIIIAISRISVGKEINKIKDERIKLLEDIYSEKRLERLTSNLGMQDEKYKILQNNLAKIQSELELTKDAYYYLINTGKISSHDNDIKETYKLMGLLVRLFNYLIEIGSFEVNAYESETGGNTGVHVIDWKILINSGICYKTEAQTHALTKRGRIIFDSYKKIKKRDENHKNSQVNIATVMYEYDNIAQLQGERDELVTENQKIRQLIRYTYYFIGIIVLVGAFALIWRLPPLSG